MPKKRPVKPASPSVPDTDELMRDLTRLLGHEQFESIEEVNAFLQREVVGKPLVRPRALTDRERAEDLVMAARIERSPAAATRKATQALALDPDCVIAHQLLAQMSMSPKTALAHARDAVAAGERVLAEELAAGETTLWYHPIGRSWLQARGLLAELLWRRGDRTLAIAEAREILARNPGDNPGMRYILLEWLMQAGSVAEIDTLLGAYDDGAAAWHFAAALHTYRVEGPGAGAKKSLRAAVATNRHVIPMLSGRKPMPHELPDTYGIGDEDEAAIYLHEAITGWLTTPGAIDWAATVERDALVRGPGKRRRL